MAIDRHGNPYLVGATVSKDELDHGKQHLTLIKLDSKGGTLWTKAWESTSDEFAISVHTDEVDNVYMGARLRAPLAAHPNAGDLPAYVTKLNAGGDVQWKREVGTDGDPVDSLTRDAEGNFYALGTEKASGGMFLAKFDRELAKKWRQRWSTDGGVSMRRLTIDREGTVYVAGSSDQKDKGFSRFVILKYGRDGSLLSEHFQKVTIYDSIHGIALDEKGNIFLTGCTYGRLGERKEQGNAQLFVIKFAPHAPPSFDCMRATTPQESLICQSARLSSLDDSIAKAFKSYLALTKNKRVAKKEQSKWLKGDRDTHTTVEQLESSMSARLDQLKARLESKPKG